MKIDRILVPTDFSDNSRHALQYAVGLAQAHGSKLTILHVIETPIYSAAGGVPGFTLPNLEAEMRESAERGLEAIAVEVVGDAVESEFEIRDGAPFVEIVRAARDLAANLIVIATHGRGGIPHLLLGSTAEKVVRKAPCPVLTFREGMPEFELP